MLKANLLPISRCRINQDHNTQKGTAIGAYIRSDSGRITRQTTVSNKHPYTHTRMHTPLPRNWPNETERLRTRIGHSAKRRHRASTLNKYCLMSLHRTARSPPSPPALKSIFASQMMWANSFAALHRSRCRRSAGRCNCSRAPNCVCNVIKTAKCPFIFESFCGNVR